MWIVCSQKCFYSFCLFVFPGVFGADTEVKSVMGDSVTLQTDVTKHQNETMLWYFDDILIAQINGQKCLFNGKHDKFRERINVVFETGSLNIKNITTDYAGHYEVKIIRSESSGTSRSFHTNHTCDNTKIMRKTSHMGEAIKTFNVSVSGESLNVIYIEVIVQIEY